MSINLYQFVGVPSSASSAEIDSAIFIKYNDVRRLVTHHDPAIVNQANEDLLIIEQARSTLLDPQKKAIYDSSLGADRATAGLTDPQASQNSISGFATPPALRSNISNKQAGEQTDAWICPKCHTENRKNIRFCKKCGTALGIVCPKCNSVNEIDTVFCKECGVNIKECAEELQQSKEEKKILDQQRIIRERNLEPIRKYANRAATFSSLWWILLGFGFYSGTYIYAYVQAGKALAITPTPGDQEYRNKATRARKTSGALIIIFLVGIAFYILGTLIFANH